MLVVLPIYNIESVTCIPAQDPETTLDQTCFNFSYCHELCSLKINTIFLVINYIYHAETFLIIRNAKILIVFLSGQQEALFSG